MLYSRITGTDLNNFDADPDPTPENNADPDPALRKFFFIKRHFCLKMAYKLIYELKIYSQHFSTLKKLLE
jgi:hypothetical protein